MSRPRVDITGTKFDRLTVIGYAGGRKWLCQCSCGNRKAVRGDHLKTGFVRSCGCLNAELASLRNLGRKGAAHPAWIGDRISYFGMHFRLERERGRAANFECVDCTDPHGRMEWSWTGCHDPRTQTTGNARGCQFCLHAEHYEPRCKGCHEAYDAERSRSASKAIA